VLRRHPVAFLLLALVIAGAVASRPPVVDVATGSPPADAALVLPAGYVALAPMSNVLDALTFLSVERAPWALGVWLLGLAAWGLLRGNGPRRRLVGGLVGPLSLVGLAAAAAGLPRPVPRLAAGDSGVTVIDYHAHTAASHDGRGGWTPERLARWHARQGFEASYVTDHNIAFTPAGSEPFPLLPGAEWSVHRQHVLALGPGQAIARDSFTRTTARMLRIFQQLSRQGAVTIASIPEYWRNHWDGLDAFIAAGVGGFEIVSCGPKALGFPAAGRRRVVAMATAHDVLVTGGSDNHGWGAVTCVWNLSAPGAGGYRANRVIARAVAVAQGDGSPVWAAAVTQPWIMFRTLGWSERAIWVTWIVLYLIYRGLPRRRQEPGGLGILARTLTLRGLFGRYT